MIRVLGMGKLSKQDIHEALEELDDALGSHAKAHDWAEWWGYRLIRAYEELAFPVVKAGFSEPQRKKILSRNKKKK
jgi:hypothetical protein